MADTAIDHQDPNVLVWIAAQKIGLKTVSDDRVWDREIPNDASNGIGKNKVVCKILKRLRRRLQTQLTGRRCRPEHRQSLERRKSKVDDSREQGTRMRTGNEVWDILRQMTLPGADIKVRRTELRKSVYVYSVENNLRRYNKWMPRLELFGIVLSEAGVDGRDAVREDLRSFQAMHKFLLEHAANPTAHTTLPAVWDGLNDIRSVPSVKVDQWKALLKQTTPEDWLRLIGKIKGLDWTKRDGLLASIRDKWDPKDQKER